MFNRELFILPAFFVVKCVGAVCFFSMEVRRRNIESYGSPISNIQSASTITSTSRSFTLIEPLQNPITLFQWICVFIICLLCICLVPLHSASCGNISPKEGEPNSTFQETLARKHLQFVTKLGPRPSGSVNNEIHAKRYLLSELQKVVKIAEAFGLHAQLEEQVARPSTFQTHAHITSYVNIPNLLLRLHDPRVSRQSEPRSVLINCHYDTAPQSPGASDAFVSCANALEVARVLAHATHHLRNNVIFLFNSAEESILPASHAFITQHRWAEEIATFINLEGAGAGGKLLVFQSGPGPASSALIDLYSSSTRYPSASVAGEEIFNFGLIPSDTDFRIFRDYGDLPGLDFAYIGNGYAYHTCYDVEERISPSCLQLAGENLLQLTERLASDPDIDSLPKLKRSFGSRNRQIYSPEGGIGSIHEHSTPVQLDSSRYVYFDVLGYFILKYPWTIGRVLHWAGVFVSLLWIFAFQRRNDRSYSGLCLALLIQMAFLFLGLIFAGCVGRAVHMFGSRMSWYTNRFNIFGIFLLPLITFFFYFHSSILKIPTSPLLNLFPLKYLLQRSKWFSIDSDARLSLKAYTIENDFFKSTVVIFDIFIALAMYVDTTVSFSPFFWCVLTICFRCLYFSFFSSFGSMKLLFIIIPPLLLFHVPSSYLLVDVFIPIMGRSGHAMQPDTVIAVLVAVSALPVLLFCADSVQITSRSASRATRLLLVNACITFLVLVHTSSLGFPYTVMPETDKHLVLPSQQRVAVFHANRNFHDTTTGGDSGIFFFPLDTNGFRYYHHPPSVTPNPFMLKLKGFMAPGPSEPFVFPELQEMEAFKFDRNVPYCGVPLLYPLLSAFDTIYYLPSAKHASPSPSLSVISQVFEQGENGERLVNLTVSVDSQSPLTQMYVRTEPNHVSLVRWSFAPEMGWPSPVSIPTRTFDEDQNMPMSAHYYINHIDPSITQTPSGHFAQPWVFWLQFAINSSSPSSTHSCDIALVSQFLDESVPHGSSMPLKTILKRLPQWAVPIYWISSYDHWRLPLTDNHK